MSEEQMESQVDVEQSEGQSEPAEQASSQPANPDQAEVSQETKASEANVPFHEHPRFKELIEQKNAYQQRWTEQQKQVEALYAKLESLEKANTNQSSKQADALIERLKSIDPEFAGRIEQLTQLPTQLKSIEERLNQADQMQQAQQNQQLYTQAMSKLDSLYKANSVPDNLKDMYQEHIENYIYKVESQGQKLGLKDLDQVFNTTHEKLSKFFDQYGRQIKESYVTEKKKDATPVSQTGGVPVRATGKQNYTSLDSVKAAIASELSRGKQRI